MSTALEWASTTAQVSVPHKLTLFILMLKS